MVCLRLLVYCFVVSGINSYKLNGPAKPFPKSSQMTVTNQPTALPTKSLPPSPTTPSTLQSTIKPSLKPPQSLLKSPTSQPTLQPTYLLRQSSKNITKTCQLPSMTSSSFQNTSCNNLNQYSKGTIIQMFPHSSSKCACIDSSSPYSFTVTIGDRDRLLVLFQGGGLCWDANSFQLKRCRIQPAPLGANGILARDSKNAFLNYTVIVLLYCSGDLFLGNSTASFVDSQSQFAQFKGAENTLFVLQWLQLQLQSQDNNHSLLTSFFNSTFDHLVIAGGSAGSIGAQVWSDYIITHFKAVSYTVLADSMFTFIPSSSIHYLYKIWNFCSVTCLIPTSLQTRCKSNLITLTHITLMKTILSKNYAIPYLFIQSKWDVTMRTIYNWFLEAFMANPVYISADEYLHLLLNDFQLMNTEVNFIVYLVESSDHLYLYVPEYFTTTEFGRYELLLVNSTATTTTTAATAATRGFPLYSWIDSIQRTTSQLEGVYSSNISSTCQLSNCSSDLFPKLYQIVTPTVQSPEPTFEPTFQPTDEPTRHPTSQPTFPTFLPSKSPTVLPSRSPTRFPTRPTSTPTFKPSSRPSYVPSSKPSRLPTFKPSRPTVTPTIVPTRVPTLRPTRKPTSKPSLFPSFKPTRPPTTPPSFIPSTRPTRTPSFPPTNQPTSPTCIPSSSPTFIPSSLPSQSPTINPTTTPTTPTSLPSSSPTFSPTLAPTKIPTTSPTITPTTPTVTPTKTPTKIPTTLPTRKPTFRPTFTPTIAPSRTPTKAPSTSPTTPQPTTASFIFPTRSPSLSPSTSSPTFLPSTKKPSSSPTTAVLNKPTLSPTKRPSPQPSFSFKPSSTSTKSPTKPTLFPTRKPTSLPTKSPPTATTTALI